MFWYINVFNFQIDKIVMIKTTDIILPIVLGILINVI